MLSLCSYFGPLCQLYIYSFSFSPPQALSCPVLLSDRGPLLKINCHALVANRFWEAERESLAKQRLHLGVGQCTEMPVWSVHPNCGSRMHLHREKHTIMSGIILTQNIVLHTNNNLFPVVNFKVYSCSSYIVLNCCNCIFKKVFISY